MMRFFIYGWMVMSAALLQAAEMRHFGDFVLKTNMKIMGDRVTKVPTKPVTFSVYTDGVKVQVRAEGDEEAQTTFDIYRSDGIGRQRPGVVDVEVVPGVQASTTRGGVLRHLRLTRDTLTITTFPGQSDQTVVMHAELAQNGLAKPPSKKQDNEKPESEPESKSS